MINLSYGKQYIKENLIKSLGWLEREIDMLVTKEQYISKESKVLGFNIECAQKEQDWSIMGRVTGANRWDSQHALPGQGRGW